MASVFKKLISKELGEPSYDKYFFSYQKRFEEQNGESGKLDNKEVYDDIYSKLKDKDITDLHHMLDRLSDAMYAAVRISKNYSFEFFFYLAAIVFLIVQGIAPIILLPSIAVMTICFLYKTYEYIVNQYCFIDAHIVLIYKTVLDRLILKYNIDKAKSIE
ncbi:hypothetical protein lbkm_4177 [Lachnospiraceae bacterium KM106-2]|nr:hypothetical protein lbkm_4177 [Lachnospiraceae bacterium KM106-2]